MTTTRRATVATGCLIVALAICTTASSAATRHPTGPGAQAILDRGLRALLARRTARISEVTLVQCRCASRGHRRYQVSSTENLSFGRRQLFHETTWYSLGPDRDFGVTIIADGRSTATLIGGRWLCSAATARSALKAKLPVLLSIITGGYGLALEPTPKLIGATTYRGIPVWRVRTLTPAPPSSSGGSIRQVGESSTTYWISRRDYTIARQTSWLAVTVRGCGLTQVQTWTRFSKYGEPLRVNVPKACRR